MQLYQKDNIPALKSFALMMSCAFPAVFALILPWLFDAAIPMWPFAISAVFLLLYFLFPKAIYIPYRGWMFIATILGWINTRIILATVFFLMFWPIGLFMRLINGLQYQRKIDKKNNSHFLVRTETITPDSLENPF